MQLVPDAPPEEAKPTGQTSKIRLVSDEGPPPTANQPGVAPSDTALERAMLPRPEATRAIPAAPIKKWAAWPFSPETAAQLERGILSPITAQNYALRQLGVPSKEDLARGALAVLESQGPMLPMEPAATAAEAALETIPSGAKLAAKGIQKAAGAAGRGAAGAIGTLGTHTGQTPIVEAYRAGRTGGEAAESFLKELKNISEPRETVAIAKRGLDSMREARNAAYQSVMGDIKTDPAVLDFAPIDEALSKVRDIAYFKTEGKPGVAPVYDAIKSKIDSWRAGPPDEFHTVFGFDQLKQHIGSIAEGLESNTQASKVAWDMYDAVRKSITNQAPTYGKIMEDYEKASDAVRELERAFSLKGDKPAVDTALRKLQSAMRNNVQTNYGARLKMAETLDEATGGELMPRLAGQSLSSIWPRGFGPYEMGASLAAGHQLSPWFYATLPFQSPQLVGRTAYGLGATARKGSEAAEATARLLGLIP